jgi:hypothetical protein
MKYRKSVLGKILTVFGDIKVYRWPMFVVYAPKGYAVGGADCREAMAAVEPGDVLLRGYDDYLDGHFIPGFFSHAGTYVGEIKPDELREAEGIDAESLFKPGPQMVVHAKAEGVLCEDLLDFCRTDRMLVLRLPPVVKSDGLRPSLIPISQFTSDELDIFLRLKRGAGVPREEITKLVVERAISRVGTPYDFKFDFADFDSLCCSEFSYWCMKCCANCLDLAPHTRRVLGIKKSMLEPDSMIHSGLQAIWASGSAVDNLAARGVRPSWGNPPNEKTAT